MAESETCSSQPCTYSVRLPVINHERK